MELVDLVFNELALAKLAARGIGPEELEQAVDNGALLIPNPHPRVAGSRLLVGPSDGGRLLTAVVEARSDDPAVLQVMTAWPSSRREILVFRRSR